jgi:nucleotide-binding universal stress UspA family protein
MAHEEDDMPLSTVVAGLDLGPTTDRVVAFARQLSSKLGAKLVNLHAEDDEPLTPEWANLALEAERRRREAAERHSYLGEAEIVWRPGPAAAALQDEAMARKAGFVVAGTGAYGKTPFLGETAIRMLRSVTVPLCLVPTHDTARTDFTGRRILAPVDFSPESDPALGYVRELAGRLEAKVALVTIVRPPAFAAHLEPESAARLPGMLRDLMEKATTALSSQAQAAGLTEASVRVIESDDPAAAILQEAREIDADLIVLPSHARGRIERLFAGSTTEKLARSSDLPVLIFPPTWLAG